VQLLDTDTAIYILNRRPDHVYNRFREADASQVGITAVTLSELRFGALNSARANENGERVNLFLHPLRILPFDEAAAERHAWLKLTLMRQGTPIGPMDMLIAAIALAGDHTLVTNNEREFARVPGLRTENWTRSPAED
jgi:tRNA(fMet)-specific endonuclease VapC